MAIFIGDIFASTLIVLFYVTIQWFLGATDVTVGYGWKWDGPNFHPSFHIRNQSGSKSYRLGNISYTKNEGRELLFIDNESVWGKELKPGSINLIEAGAVRGVADLRDCIGTEVTVRLQNGRQFWLKGQGPGQLHMGRVQKIAFWLRQKFEKAAIPLE
ncbi:MAG: hypothetical protein ACYDCD_04085 [Candidatus Acidiferrales bacterium]